MKDYKVTAENSSEHKDIVDLELGPDEAADLLAELAQYMQANAQKYADNTPNFKGRLWCATVTKK